MRIAQVVSAYHPHIGGVETVVQRLADGCAEAGDQVTVLTHQIESSPAEERMCPVRVLRFPFTVAASNYQVSLKLFRYLHRNAGEYDVVHAHSYHTLVGHAAIRSGLPFVFTPHYHGTGHSLLRAMLHHVYRPIGSKQFRLADAVICVSDAERRLVLQISCAAPKLVAIPLGTDIMRPPQIPNFRTPNAPLVLVVGRLERYNNQTWLLRHSKVLISQQVSLLWEKDRPITSRKSRQGIHGWWPDSLHR